METASERASTRSGTVGSAKRIIEGGSTSETPPTLVDTTNSPQEEASSRAMQKDSVSEQLKKTWPRTSTSATSYDNNTTMRHVVLTSDLVMRHSSEQLDAIMELVLLPHLF